MYKCFISILLAVMMSGCSFFQVRKPIIEQGNIITEQDTAKLHQGMSTNEVIAIMGSPLVVNLFTPDRMEYIYTYQARRNPRIVKRVVLLFRRGRLQVIRRDF